MLFDAKNRRHYGSLSPIYNNKYIPTRASVYDNLAGTTTTRTANGDVSKQRRDELLQEQQRRSAAQQPSLGNIHLERMQRCKNCCKSFTTFIFSRVGLCLLVVGYAVGGGLVFELVEKHYEDTKNDIVQQHINITVEKLFEHSMNSTVLHQKNWTVTAKIILEEYQKHLVRQLKRGSQSARSSDETKQWTVPGAILYAITVITTIGYGHITCQSAAGKVITMIYAVFGIPLMLLCLANIGSTMADAFRFIYCNICCSYCNMVKKRRNLRALQSVELSRNIPSSSSSLPPSPTATSLSPNTLSIPSTNLEQPPSPNVVEFVDNLSIDYRKVTIPISVTLSLLSSYLILGAILFSEWEGWGLLDGAYFCFVTLATIGLGDFVPGKSVNSTQVEGKLIICALYVLLGLSLMAMCFNLMQEEVRAKFRRLGNKLGIIDDPNFW